MLALIAGWSSTRRIFLTILFPFERNPYTYLGSLAGLRIHCKGSIVIFNPFLHTIESDMLLCQAYPHPVVRKSLAVIGAQCGNKDHATVLHACKQIENLRQTDRYMRAMVEELEKKFAE